MTSFYNISENPTSLHNIVFAYIGTYLFHFCKANVSFVSLLCYGETSCNFYDSKFKQLSCIKAQMDAD